jgi:hypothetical protein
MDVSGILVPGPALAEERAGEAVGVEGDDEQLPPGLEAAAAARERLGVVLKVLDDVEQGDGVEVIVRKGEGRLGPLLDHLPPGAPPRLLHRVGGDLQAVRRVAPALQRLQEEAVAGADVEHPAARDAVRAEEPHQVIEVLHLARVKLKVLALEVGRVMHRRGC